MFTVATLNVAATATVAPALAGLRVLSGAVGAFGGFLGNIASTALGVLGGQALFAGLSAGFQSAVGAAIGLNATLEDNTVAFTTLLHSGAAAQSFLGQLRDFAAATPFEFVGLAQTAKVMLGMGFTAQQIIPLLTDIGNVAAGLSLGSAGANRLGIVLGQMHTSGRVLGQDLLQLQQAGINTADVFGIMATQTGKSVPQFKAMQEAGKLPADWFITAFQTFSRMKFGGMLEAQANNFTGIWENVKEVFGNVFGTIFVPLFQQLKEVGKDILAFQQTATFKQWVAMLQTMVGQATTIFGAWRSTWGNLMKVEGLSFFQAGLTSLELVIRAVFGASAAATFHNFLARIAEIPAFFTGTLLPAFHNAAAWVTGTLLPAFTHLAGIIAHNVGPIIAFVVAFQGVLTAVSIIAGVIAAVTLLVTPLGLIALAAGFLAAAWVGNWGDIQGKVGAVWAFLQPILTDLHDWLGTHIPAALATLASFWTDTLLPALTTVWDFLSTKIAPVFSGLAAVEFVLLGKAVEALAGLWQNILLPALQAVGTFIEATLLPRIQSLWGWMAGKLQPIFAAIGNTIKLLGGQAPVWLTGLAAGLQVTAATINAAPLPAALTPAGGTLPPPPAGTTGGGSVDRSTTVTFNNPVVRSDQDIADIATQVALSAANGQASAADVLPNQLVGGS